MYNEIIYIFKVCDYYDCLEEGKVCQILVWTLMESCKDYVFTCLDKNVF